MAHSTRTRLAISAGARRADRSRLVRERVAIVLAALVRIGRTDCFRPQIRERALREALKRIAATSDPETPERAAVRITLVRTPQAFAMYLRRNPEFLQT